MQITVWRAGAISNLVYGEWLEDHYPIVEVWGVVVVDNHGNRLGYCGGVATKSRDQANNFATRINLYLRDHPEWNPRDEFWNPLDPAYGSQAYQDQGTEAVWAAREREEDPYFYEGARRHGY